MVNEKITLNASKNNVDIVLKAIQGENDARAFEVTVTDINGVPVPLGGATANMYIEKRDGNIVMLPGTVSGNSATFVLTLQASSVPGDNKVWVQIVEPDVMDLRADGAVLRVTPCDLDGAVESSGEFTALTELVASAASSAQSAAGSASAAAQSAAQAAESVQSLTVNGKQGPSITLTAADVGAPTEEEFSALDEQTEEHIGDSLIHFQMSSVFDAVYPVGSYYETSDSAFDPNTTFGGTWVQDTKGRVTVAVDPDDPDFNASGKTGGQKAVTLTTAQIPNINLRVNYELVKFASLGTDSSQDHAFVRGTYPNGAGMSSGNVSPNGVGGGGAHTNLQPYVTVYRWHRTA